jgi:predicted aconitase
MRTWSILIPAASDHNKEATVLELSVRDKAMLSGELGDGAALAMRIVVATAHVMKAQRLVDISSAHIDGCLYHGSVSLDFVERFVASGTRVAVPTTLNVGSLDLIHPELYRGKPETANAAKRLMEAHLELGCEAHLHMRTVPAQAPPTPGRSDRVG